MKVDKLKINIEKILDNNKAKSITSIDLRNKSYIADYMIVASGTSSRHLQSLSEILVSELKKIGLENCRIEGRDSSDWKLVDAHDIIIHIFHPEKREFYDLEKCGLKKFLKKKQWYEKLLLLLLIFTLTISPVFSKNDLYEKIDLFGEVLENIKDYVDDVDQAEIMDSAINGVLQSLDPYSAYMSPELFNEMQTDTRGEFGGLGIEIGMESE